MSGTKRVNVMEVALTNATDDLSCFLHIHAEHAAVKIVNIQIMLYLGIMCLGILAFENNTVVDVVISRLAAVIIEEASHNQAFTDKLQTAIMGTDCKSATGTDSAQKTAKHKRRRELQVVRCLRY